MPGAIRPDLSKRASIAEIAKADSHRCWTCKMCATECPINIATNSLSPIKIVRMAALGLMDEMVRLPEIWYCLACRRCNSICPMLVKPLTLIEYSKWESFRRGLISIAVIQQQQALVKRLHRARWLLAKTMLAQTGPSTNASECWRISKDAVSGEAIQFITLNRRISIIRPDIEKRPNITLCLTCGECCSVCPTFYEGTIFNPMKILRMAVLGLSDTLISSPSIWLCLGCQRCAEVCSQYLSIYEVIRYFKQAAVTAGLVSAYFQIHFQDQCKALYKHFIAEMNAIYCSTKGA